MRDVEYFVAKVEFPCLKVEPYYPNVERDARNVERAYLIRQSNERCRIFRGESRISLPESRTLLS